MRSKEEIFDRMLSDIKTAASKIEGSFTVDNLNSVANELARFYDIDYDTLLNRAFVDTATDEDLDRVGLYNHQVKRKEATFEEVNVKITGNKGVVVDENIVFIADNIRFKPTERNVIPDNGILNITLRCQEPGSGKQIQENTLKFLETYEGLQSVTNMVSKGGRDRESDKEYRKRILELERDVKGYGNISYYKTISKEVPGVDRVKVIDLARGLGTVDIVIIANDNKEADTALIEQVRSYIKDKKMAGADISVYSAAKKEILVDASVYHEKRYSTENIKNEFMTKVNEYFKALNFSEGQEKIRVSYARILNILATCEGVDDVSTLLINKLQTSLELNVKEFPVLGFVSLQKAG